MLKFAKMFPRTRFKNVQKCVEIWQNELKTNKLKFAKIFFMTIFKNGNVFKFAEMQHYSIILASFQHLSIILASFFNFLASF